MYDARETELGILEFWNKNKILDKLRKKNKGKKSFYFLDGPPYTSGKVHIGTAWNKVLKDLVLRHKRMRGFDVFDRAGYDMHGLPIEHQVESLLGIKEKADIEKMGVKIFADECKNFAISHMHSMNKDFARLGVWMDFENAYMSVKNEFIEGVWWLVKEADKKKRLYEGLRTMHWCAKCETALAKHELEYKQVEDNSIFFKLKIKNKKDEFLIIWTTTPWTVAFNLAVMADPEITYIRAKVGNETWLISKDLAKSVIKDLFNRDYKVLQELKGKKLEGLEYTHPFKDIVDFEGVKESKRIHTVILSREYVDKKVGSGLIHCAPDCGIEDYEVAYKYKIPSFASVDEKGRFPREMPGFRDLKAREDDGSFIEELEKRNSLLLTSKITHDYPHCQRCHRPVIFRATTQWFFKIEDLIPKMIKENKKSYWVPKAAFNAFDSWLRHLRDNSITKQRYWGTPIPIWKCKGCSDYIVVGSIKELERLSKRMIKELHKPDIDQVTIKCGCGGKKTRIPDILDVWVDAGSASWNALDFPRNKLLIKKLFPADFILEGKDQIRGWFNLLLISSMISMNKHSFRSVYMHGFVQDALGRKMSKSLGNYILPQEVVDKYGADTFRYYIIGGASPGLDLNYNFKDMEVKNKNLLILWNLHIFLIEQAKLVRKSPVRIRFKKLDVEERYILSRLNSTIRDVTNLLDCYLLNRVPDIIESLFIDLSRTYVQIVRDKSSIGKKEEKELVLLVTYKVFIETLKLFSIVCPFITERIYQNLKKEFKLKEESIHSYNWPGYSKKLINKNLETGFSFARTLLQEILAQREKAKLGIRWPLNEVIISVEKVSNIKKIAPIIKKQANVKNVVIKEGKFNVKLDTNLTKELEREGFSREMMRRIQALRKKSGLKKNNIIDLTINSDYDLGKYKKEIMEKVGAKDLKFNTLKGKFYSKEKIREREFEIAFDVLK